MEGIGLEWLKERLVPLMEEKDLRLIVAFGSLASGKVHGRSDIDLAFLFDGPVDLLSLTNRVIRLLHTDRVDVVDLRVAPPLLRYSVARGGRVVYERRRGDFNEFYSLAFRMYVDTKKLRDARRRAIMLYLQKKGLA